MADDLVAAAAVVVDAPVERLQQQPSCRRAGDERMEAPAKPVDLDDVADLDPFESHASQCRRFARGAPVGACRGEGAWGEASGG
jgi:hypothetical protein